MRKIITFFAVIVWSFTIVPAAFAQTTSLQTSPNLRLNNLQLISPDKLKAIQVDETKPGQTKKDENKPVEIPRIPWETIAVVISILSGLAAIMGFSVSSHKKKRAISKYMGEIDETFSEYKWKTKRCEAELYRLRDLLEERLKKGKIDESLYELLTKRIDKYLHEIQNLPSGG